VGDVHTSHVSFIVNSNSENCIKIRWFFTKLHTKISWLHFCGSRCIYRLLVYIVCFPTYLFFCSFPYLSFPLKIYPLCFHARGRKRQPYIGLFSCFILVYAIVFLFLMRDYLCSVSLGLMFFVVIFLVFDFCFPITSQQIGWEGRLRHDLFCVEWYVKP